MKHNGPARLASAVVGFCCTWLHSHAQQLSPPQTFVILKTDSSTTAGYVRIVPEGTGVGTSPEITDRKQVYFRARYLDSQTPSLDRMLRYGWLSSPTTGSLTSMIQQEDAYAAYPGQVGRVVDFRNMRASNTGAFFCSLFALDDQDCTNGVTEKYSIFRGSGVAPNYVNDHYGIHAPAPSCIGSCELDDQVCDSDMQCLCFDTVDPVAALDSVSILSGGILGEVSTSNIILGPRYLFNRVTPIGQDIPTTSPEHDYRLKSVDVSPDRFHLSLGKREVIDPVAETEYWLATQVLLKPIDDVSPDEVAIWAQPISSGLIPRSDSAHFILHEGSAVPGLPPGWVFGNGTQGSDFIGVGMNAHASIVVHSWIHDTTTTQEPAITTYVMAKSPNYGSPKVMIRNGDTMMRNGIEYFVQSVFIPNGDPGIPQEYLQVPLLNDRDELVVGVVLSPVSNPNRSLDALVRVSLDQSNTVQREIVALVDDPDHPSEATVIPAVVDESGHIEYLKLVDIDFGAGRHPVGNGSGDIAFFARLYTSLGVNDGYYLVRFVRSRCNGADMFQGLFRQGLSVLDQNGSTIHPNGFGFASSWSSGSGSDGRPVAINSLGQIIFLSNWEGPGNVLLMEPSFSPHCVTDVDDGTGTGAPDCGVTIDDMLFYLALFEAGDTRADLDDGTGSGNPDGGVTIDDLLFYILRFADGC